MIESGEDGAAARDVRVDTSASAGQPSAPVVRAKLDAFVSLLLKKNATLNLTAAKTAEAVENHVRDALFLVPHVSGPLIDIGSGGGLPAIVIAIAAGIHCVLVESLAKKAAFLHEVARELDLDVEVLARRAEDVAREPEYRERFACATARAVGPATTVLELTVPFLRVGGHALLQRGRERAGERQALSDAALVLGVELEPDVVDRDSESRRVVIARKIVPTGERFPRRAGIPAKRPLCWVGEAADV